MGARSWGTELALTRRKHRPLVRLTRDVSPQRQEKYVLTSPASKAAVIIAVLVTTLTAFLVVELFTKDELAALILFILFLVSAFASLCEGIADHHPRKDG